MADYVDDKKGDGLDAKTTPVDADLGMFWDSVDTIIKGVTWANIKATLKAYFDTLYQPVRTVTYNLTTSPQAVALPASGADVLVVIGSNGAGTNTGLANAMVFSAPTGGVAGQRLTYAILSDASARALDFTNAIFVPIGIVKPTTTVGSKWIYVGCVYNAVTSKLDVLAVSPEL
jgi:hypothetical protein